MCPGDSLVTAKPRVKSTVTHLVMLHGGRARGILKLKVFFTEAGSRPMRPSHKVEYGQFLNNLIINSIYALSLSVVSLHSKILVVEQILVTFKKNPAYQRQSISRLMRIIPPIPQ